MTLQLPVTPNVPLLRKTLEYIEAHPEEWDQSTWRCGSVACFAGRAADLAGADWVEGVWAGAGLEDYAYAEDGEPADRRLGGRPVVSTAARARRVLQLNPIQAADLFLAENTLDDLRLIVADLTAEAES